MYPSIRELQMVKQLLNTYEVAFDQAVNYNKSKLYGINIDPSFVPNYWHDH